MTDNLENLRGTHVVLGVCGGISCYKSADLVRKLIEVGAEVQVVMTNAAQEFVTDLTFQALSGNPVHTDLLDPAAEAAMGHIELARWADVVVIAPATANTLARLAQGMADDLLTTICLATEAPVCVAPAMNRIMWANAATQDNVNTLRSRDYTIAGPGSGDQACGEVGAGRMLEPLEIRDTLAHLLARLPSGLDRQSRLTIPENSQHVTQNKVLSGVHMLLTAGPTREQIDPVRFLSNNSSGKMGFSLAEQAVLMGATVTLIAGPVTQDTPEGIERIDVKSAADMHQAVMARARDCDIFVAVAAVADYRMADIAAHKLKKTEDNLTLQLTRTEDILASVAALAAPPFCVGFAAETQNIEQYARGKLEKKKLHMIAANPVVQQGEVVFGSDTNSLQVFWRAGGQADIASAPKQVVAAQLLELIVAQYRAQQSN